MTEEEKKELEKILWEFSGRLGKIEAAAQLFKLLRDFNKTDCENRSRMFETFSCLDVVVPLENLYPDKFKPFLDFFQGTLLPDFIVVKLFTVVELGIKELEKLKSKIVCLAEDLKEDLPKLQKIYSALKIMRNKITAHIDKNELLENRQFSYDLLLMSDLPSNGQPAERTIYCKKTVTLTYTMKVPDGRTITADIDLDIPEITKESLTENRNAILKKIVENGHAVWFEPIPIEKCLEYIETLSSIFKKISDKLQLGVIISNSKSDPAIKNVISGLEKFLKILSTSRQSWVNSPAIIDQENIPKVPS